MTEQRPQSSNPNSGGGGGRRRRHRGGNRGGPQGPGPNNPNREARPQGQNSGQGPTRPQGNRGGSRRRSGGRPLTANQVCIKYDNLLDQHLITRRKYYEYFNRVDDRQLRRLEHNFYTSLDHLRRFEANLEPWQREALEKRKTERYRPDLTYSLNRNLDLISNPPQVEVSDDEITDPHFKDSQKEAFEEYKEDTEESVGTFEDYLKLKGL